LSSKQVKKKKGAKPATMKPEEEGPRRPAGKAPLAMVSARHGTEMITRPGRGFSLSEISGAGLTPRSASDWGARIDYRRRSVLESNVASLRNWGGHLVAVKKHEGRVKKVEEELAKVEKEVEKEVEAGVAEVEKEAVKVEKAVKKVAAKAEKAGKAKAAKPRAKAKPKAKKKEGS
jgi:ribosomal protein L13E